MAARTRKKRPTKKSGPKKTRRTPKADDATVETPSRGGYRPAEEVDRIIADRFSAELTARFGVDRLWLLLQYLDRAPEIDGALDALAVRIRTTSAEGHPYLVAFAEARVEELERALEMLDGGWEGRLEYLPPGGAELHHRFSHSMHEVLGKDSPRIQVGYRERGRKKRVYFNLQGLPGDRLEDVARAIARALEPAKSKARPKKAAKPSAGRKTRKKATKKPGAKNKSRGRLATRRKRA